MGFRYSYIHVCGITIFFLEYGFELEYTLFWEIMNLKYIVNVHVDILALTFLTMGAFDYFHLINMVMRTTFKSNKLREWVNITIFFK